MGSRHTTTTAFHPQTNGQVERMNHTLAPMLSMYVADNHQDWDQVLPFVVFAYNTARQETKGFSPFFLLYGREASLPSDAAHLVVVNGRRPLKTTAGRDHLAHLQRELAIARQLVLERMSKAHRMQSET